MDDPKQPVENRKMKPLEIKIREEALRNKVRWDIIEGAEHRLVPNEHRNSQD